MSITIATNVDSLKAQTNFSGASSRLSKSYQRLSSGLRITSASDDAAGLAIADSLRRDSRIAAVGVRNANDGVSLIAIADGALEQIGNVLARMAELAEQSANGTLSATQRSAISSEFTSLGSEIDRIANTTEFNAIKLLSGTQTFSLQVGLDAGSNSQITFSGVQGTTQALGLSSGAALTASVNNASNALAALTSVRAAISSLATNRGTLGAAESRLNVAIANLQVARENFVAAESQIRDVDVAEEAAELTRLGILQQAGAAVLAQANQQPGLALALLG